MINSEPAWLNFDEGRVVMDGDAVFFTETYLIISIIRIMINPLQDKDIDYPILKKMLIVVFWVQELKYNTDLKENGYLKKYHSRKICILLGVFLYALIIAIANIYFFQK